MSRMTRRTAFLLGLGLATGASVAGAQTLNLYTARHYDSDEALYEGFEAETGIEVNVLEGDSDQLIERIRREGAASPADVFMTVDAARLNRAEEADILAPVDSEFLEERLPVELQHPEDMWFGFSERTRIIYWDRETYDEAPLSTYEELADPRFAGEICVHSSSNDYSQSLVAAMISSGSDPSSGIVAYEALAESLKSSPPVRSVMEVEARASRAVPAASRALSGPAPGRIAAISFPR